MQELSMAYRRCSAGVAHENVHPFPGGQKMGPCRQPVAVALRPRLIARKTLATAINNRPC